MKYYLVIGINDKVQECLYILNTLKMKKRIMKTIGTNMMTKLKLLTALLFLASRCANNESQDETDELNSNLQKELTGCYINLDNTELAIESCLYELDENATIKYG